MSEDNGDEAGLSLRERPSDPGTNASPIAPSLRRAVAEIVLETTSEGVWLIDADARTTFVNQHMAQLLGYTVEEMIGRPIFDFVDDEGRRIANINLERRRGGVAEQHESKCVRKDGSAIWLLLATNPVFDRRGRYAGALAMAADLSEHKRREQDLAGRVSELKGEVSALTELALTDALTGLGNRRHFEQRLAEEVSRCQRYLGRFCVILIDIDRLERVNDQHGHQSGDAVLKTVAHALRPSPVGVGLVRSSDAVARYGGDKLAVIAVETTLQGGVLLSDRILERVRSSAITTAAGARLQVTASIGIASFPMHGVDAAGLVAAADAALNEAKRAGGARVRLAEPVI